MKYILFLLGIFLPLSLTFSAGSGEISREALERLWEKHMLDGTFAIYSDGTRTNYLSERSFEAARGSPSEVWTTKQGIAISDRRDTKLLGLWRGGGWSIFGGMLARVSAGFSSIELYGRVIVSAQPSFFLNFHPSNETEYGYDFFLVKRNTTTRLGTVAKRWTFSSDEAIHIGRITNVRAQLAYDPANTVAIVTITGLKRPFEERIDLSKVLGERK